MTATRLGFKIAEKKKWLPSSVYHQLALEKLRTGNLEEAVKLNNIALQKRPNFEKALVVKDLLAMQRDALIAKLLKSIEQEKTSIKMLQKADADTKRQLKLIKIKLRLFTFLPLLFLFLNIFIYLWSYVLLIVWQHPMAGSLLGGSAIVGSILVYFYFQFVRDRDIQERIKKDELLSAQYSKTQELAIHQKRLRTLQSQLSQTRYQFMVK